jgi:hypothetical protein
VTANDESSESFICEKEIEIQPWAEKLVARVWGGGGAKQVVLFTWSFLNMGLPSTKSLHCNTQNCKTTIKKSSEAHGEHLAAT